MFANFGPALTLVLAHEGGYVNLKSDPGGPTNKGVTQRVYDAYMVSKARPQRSVQLINSGEIGDIYRNQYWGTVGDNLPVGIDYAVFDYSVNSGPGRAIKDLQRCLGVEADGNCGVGTLAAVARADKAKLVNDYCDRRLAFLKSLGTFKVFGKGWARRVEEVRAAATHMLSQSAPIPLTPPLPTLPAQGKADPASVAPSTAPARVAGLIGAVAAGSSATLAHPSLWPYVLGLAVVIMAVIVFMVWRGNKDDELSERAP